MKIKKIIVCLALNFGLTPVINATESLPSLKESMQKVVIEYYQQYRQSERFTALAASVLIPQTNQANTHQIETVVMGSKGLPPFTQPITADDLFEIGSITKSFTALMLLQLQAEGKLSMQDKLGKWLPQYPNWQDVTITQLLNMTSGIPNYSEDPVFEKKMDADLKRVWTNEELLTYAHPELPLKINKDNHYEYCNSNYILAAMIIEKATNDTYANQLSTRIINAKNGLNNTYYPAGAQSVARQTALSPRKIHGYFYDDKTGKDVDVFNNNLTWAGAAGAIVANTADVIRWVQLLYHGSLIPAPYRENALTELESVVSMKTGQSITGVNEKDPGGFGLGVGEYYDKEIKQPFWVYQGSTLGFRVMYFWSACNDVTTVVAINSKGSEGKTDSKLGNHILEANVDLYKAVIKLYPDLKCDV